MQIDKLRQMAALQAGINRCRKQLRPLSFCLGRIQPVKFGRHREHLLKVFAPALRAINNEISPQHLTHLTLF
jgi:hypothetical protein